MIDAITVFYEKHEVLLGLMAGFSIVMFAGSLLSLPWLLSFIPADYFENPEPYRLRHEFRHPLVRFAVISIKNLLGWILILSGIVMLVLPGQGIITLVMGLLLIDFPGKRAVEFRLVSKHSVLRSINWLRARRGREPLRAPAPGKSS